MNIEFDRAEAVNQTREETMRRHMKQHADKLIREFEKLDETHARRAIWELFQNAIDLSCDCEITIIITEDTLEFRHNGDPFTTDTLDSLIKQVSSKSAESNIDEVGQYGTGFIATHSFGKRITLSGTLQVGVAYFRFDDFEIDRVANNAEEMMTKLEEQEKRIYSLIMERTIESEPMPFTSFKYHTMSDMERRYAENAISALSHILPYVMTLNGKLKSVRVIDKDGCETIYCKGPVNINNEGGLTVTSILIDGTEKIIYSISSPQDDITVILPLREHDHALQFGDNISRLFLFYPLIGTEGFGFNFLVHCRQFSPTNERNGIHLRSLNETLQEKEAGNRDIMDHVFELLSDFMEKRCGEITDAHLLAEVGFITDIPENELLSKYFKDMKNRWVDRFKTFPLVETINGRIRPEYTRFFNEELLKNYDYFDSIYAIASLFYVNIPRKEIAKQWAETVDRWEDDAIERINIEDIAIKIAEKGTLDYFREIGRTDDLLRFYEYVIEEGREDIFRTHALLPNIDDEFKIQVELKVHTEIDDPLTAIAKVLMPDVPKKFLNPKYELRLDFDSYELDNFVKDINDKLSDMVDVNPNGEFLRALIEYCSISLGDDTKSMRHNFIPLVCEYFDVEISRNNLQGLKERWWRFPTNVLLRILIADLNQRNSEEYLDFIKRLLTVVWNKSDFEDTLPMATIWPNQRFKLCRVADLEQDDSIHEGLKDLYDVIVNPSKPIRNTLLHCEFNDILKEPKVRTPRSIGGEIETKLSLQTLSDDAIATHQHIDSIRKIIACFSEPSTMGWADYFPVINSKKASIMLALISGADVKEHLFSIIGAGANKIALLGQLARCDNLEDLYNKIAETEGDNADYRHKHLIGTHIERLIRERIGKDISDFSAKPEEEQGGQDIVIRCDGRAVYYIEVKSRWDARSGSITMSPLQMERAVGKYKNYSLFYVDMTDYNDPDRFCVSDVDKIIDRIKVLSDIGERFRPLVDGILSRDVENEVSLTREYRGNIPLSVARQGIDFGTFMNTLTEIVRVS